MTITLTNYLHAIRREERQMGAKARIERQAPAPDNGIESTTPIVRFVEAAEDTLSYFDGYSEYDLDYAPCCCCCAGTCQDDAPFTIRMDEPQPDADENHPLGFANTITLDEINTAGTFIVTRNRFYA